MNFFSISEIKTILNKYDARPSKRMGQNFLIDKNVLKKIIEAADLNSEDIVLEIGPGVGTLTGELAKSAAKVVAVEKDKKMCGILRETLDNSYAKNRTIASNSAQLKNIEIINTDVLKTDVLKINISKINTFVGNTCATAQTLPTFKYKIVANLPYYITSPVIRKFLEAENPPELMVLMIQKEVAQRICAKPPDMSLLAVSVQFYVHPAKLFNRAGLEIVSYVSRNCFWPSPKVDSAIIKITPNNSASNKLVRGRTSNQLLLFNQLFFEIVKAGFRQPKKQLVNNLIGLKFPNNVKLTKERISAWLLKNNIKPEQRAETLSVADWRRLTNDYKNASR